MGLRKKIRFKRLGPDETRRHTLMLIGFILREFKLPFIVLSNLIKILKKVRRSREGWFYIPLKVIRKEIGFVTIKCIKGRVYRRDSLCRLISYMKKRRIAIIIKDGVKRSRSYLILHPDIVEYFRKRIKLIEQFLLEYKEGGIFISEEDAKAEFIQIFRKLHA